MAFGTKSFFSWIRLALGLLFCVVSLLAGGLRSSAQELNAEEKPTAKANVSGEGQASTVTLQGKGLSLSEVLAAIEEQTGNQFEDPSGLLQDAGHPTIEADFQKVPFWKALDQVLDQVGMRTEHQTQGEAIVLQRARTGDWPRARKAQYFGAFRLEPIRLLAERDLRRAGAGRLHLTVEVAWEPRLHPVALELSMGDLRIEDQNGDPIEVADPEAVLSLSLESMMTAVEFGIPLKVPSREVSTIARVQGSILALLPGKAETFRFENLAKAAGSKIRQGGVTLVFQEVRRNNDLWDVRILMQLDESLKGLASHPSWFYQNDRQMLDPHLKEVEEFAEELTSRTEDEIGLIYAYELPVGPKNHTFVYQTPTSFFELVLPFELKEIELP